MLKLPATRQGVFFATRPYDKIMVHEKGTPRLYTEGFYSRAAYLRLMRPLNKKWFHPAQAFLFEPTVSL